MIIQTCHGEEFPDLNKPYEHVGGILLGPFHPPKDTSCSRLLNPSYCIEGGSGIRISPQEATPGGHNLCRSRKHPATQKSKCLKYTQEGVQESTRVQQFATQEGEPKASKNFDVDLITAQCDTDVSQAGFLGSPKKGNNERRPPYLNFYNWNFTSYNTFLMENLSLIDTTPFPKRVPGGSNQQHTTMKQTQKRRCQSSPEPSSTPPGKSDARTQSDADDTNIAVSDDDQTGQELTNAEEL
ncbi:hypothetical protein PSTT_03659, partial [Puccinia striiformis]